MGTGCGAWRPGDELAHYRLYYVGESGHFFRCEEFEAADDQAAIAWSVALRRDHPAELWCGARMVAGFPGPAPPRDPSIPTAPEKSSTAEFDASREGENPPLESDAPPPRNISGSS